MSETRAYSRLKRLFPTAHWQRIESWTGAGIFDANGCLRGSEIWIECKEAKAPKTARGKVRCKVRAAQVSWELKRRLAGGRTFVALVVGDALFLLKGQHLALLKEGVTYAWLMENHLPAALLF